MYIITFKNSKAILSICLLTLLVRLIYAILTQMNKQKLTQKILQDLRTQQENEDSNNHILIMQELKNNPTFKELDSQVRNLTLDIAKADFAGKSTTALKKKLELFSKQHTEHLKKILPTSVQSKLDIEKEVNKLLYKQSGLPNSKLSNLKFTGHPPELQKIYSQLEKYIAKFPNTLKDNIVLIGGVGTGKTVASQILGNALVQKGIWVLYMTSFALVNRFKAFIFERDQNAFQELVDCEFLIIDDLGTEPIIPNITEESLFALINERLVNKRPFLVTTNLSEDGLLERYDSRIGGRLLSKETSAVIHFPTTDFRIKKASNEALLTHA